MAKTRLVPQNFEMFAGNTKPVIIDVVDHNGNPVDLTGATGDFVLSETEGSPALVTRSGTFPGTPNNRIEFTLLPADTSARGSRSLRWEATITDTGGRVTTVAYGFVQVIARAA